MVGAAATVWPFWGAGRDLATSAFTWRLPPSPPCHQQWDSTRNKGKVALAAGKRLLPLLAVPVSPKSSNQKLQWQDLSQTPRAWYVLFFMVMVQQIPAERR